MAPCRTWSSSARLCAPQPIIRKRATAQAKENSRIARSEKRTEMRGIHMKTPISASTPSVHIQPTTPLS